MTDLITFVKKYAVVGVVWSLLLLQPIGRAFEVSLAIMALAGIVLLAKNYHFFIKQKSVRAFSVIFLMIWMPMLLSVFSEVRPDIVATKTLVFLRYYFAGLFIVVTMQCPWRRQLLLKLSSLVLLFWVLDALLQAVMGADLFGLKAPATHLNGVFGRHLHLGMFLTVFSPLLLLYFRQQRSWFFQLLVFISTLVVILLSGTRGAWIGFAVILIGYIAFQFKKNRRLALQFLLGFTVLIVLGAAISYQYVPGFSSRVRQSLLVFNSDSDAINMAISGRVPIWSVSWKMFQSNALIGVGAGAFRYAYPEYAAPDDKYFKKETGASHAHQLLLEVMSGTGIIGLIGLFGFFAVLINIWWTADLIRQFQMLPFGLGLLGALFPLNTHFSLYSSIWAQIIFWFAALYVASSYSDLLTKKERSIVD